MSKITMGSLFDGSGGFPLAGELCGIEPLWASEIEPYPIAVTSSRFPNMKHLGNVSDIRGGEIEPVDIITFGSPCQDMSVAGKRAGLKHEVNGDDETTRSGLFMEAVRIIREMRKATNGERPRFVLWENVPGAFSSNQGEDFRTVLGELVRIVEPNAVMPPVPKAGWPYADSYSGDGWSLAYRVFDAQYWGVTIRDRYTGHVLQAGTPQRRRRIYLVIDLRGERAGKILFEREGVRWDSAQSREAREGASENAAGGAGRSNFYECMTNRGYPCGVISETLREGSHGAIPMVAAFMGGQGAKAGGIGYSEQVSPTLKSVLSGGNTVPDVVYQEKARTLAARHDSSPCADRGQNIVALDCRNMIGNTEVSATLQAKNEGGFSLNFVNPIVYDIRQITSPQNRSNPKEGDPCCTLSSTSHAPIAVCVGNGRIHQTDLGEKTGALNCMHDQQAVIHSAKHPRRYIVRRLTPLECCRLQGFPDGWADTPNKDRLSDDEYQFWMNVRNTHASVNGKVVKDYTREQMIKWYNGLHTDSAEYKMWGNGIALPTALYCMQGIAEEIMKM